MPHGHTLQARCKDLGLYKLSGETRVLCSNGLWAPRMPHCVPTTLLTNFAGSNFSLYFREQIQCSVLTYINFNMRIENLDDSPPSIRIQIPIGSGAFEPSGVLAVLPRSTIHLDCMYPRSRGNPEWTSTGLHQPYHTGKIYNSV